MSSKKKKQLVIGRLFSSSDSSDNDDFTPNRARNAVSESEQVKRKAKLRINMTSASEKSDESIRGSGQRKPLQSVATTEAPDGYVAIDKSRITKIKHNTHIQYEKLDGKIVKTKYFKKYDRIAGSILVGFYLHNKRNYSELLSNIKTVFIQGSIEGGANGLKDTIEVLEDQWKTLRRDMVISYEKKDGEYIYRAKFNAFIKGKDGTSRISFTSEQGFNYIANPDNIEKMFRHITSNDRTLTFILEAIRKLDSRVKALEQKKVKH